MPVIIKSDKCPQEGALTLGMSLIMLALSLSSALYTAKTKLLDIRIANSELRKNQAQFSAEAGLAYAISQLEAVPNFSKTLNRVVQRREFSVNIAPILDNAVPPQAKTSNGVDRFYHLVASGASDDNTGYRVIEQKVRIAPIIQAAPDSAITVSGGITLGGAFTVAGNPNGGGPGVPLSLWSDSPVALMGNGSTCGLQEFDNNTCNNLAYSDASMTKMDVFDDDLVPVGTFPVDLFAYTFGVPVADYGETKRQAERLLANCDSLGVDDVGLIWVTGDCQINANNIVGRASSPVILVVENADLTINGGALIYGLVYCFTSVPGSAGTVQMVGGATIRGAFMSDHAINLAGGGFNTRFDQDVLNAMVDGTNTEFMSVQIIAGSWKDF